MLEGAFEPLTEDWSANKREEDLENLRERLEREMVCTFMEMIRV